MRKTLLKAFLVLGLVLAINFVLNIFGCSLTSLFTYIFNSSPSQIDLSQFNTNRISLAEDAAEEVIMPSQVGNFLLDSIQNNDEYMPPEFQRDLFAQYKTQSGEEIRLSASLISDDRYRTNMLYTGESCADCGSKPAQVNTTPNMSYAYAFCGCWNFAQHTLNWTNGHWVLSASAASTLHTDSSDLLKFVNDYPH
jgi:hypothetical protein